MTAKSKLKKIVTPIALNIQRYFRFFPRGICLISGAPRSGTSAVCKWLGLQPSVLSFHESRILPSASKFVEEAFLFRNLESDKEKIANLAQHLVYDYYSSSRVLLNKKLVIDKEPLEPIAFPSKDYFQFILNTKKILPKIKLLYVIRDPIATIWSMSHRAWGESLTIPEARRFSLEEYIANWNACAEIALQLSFEPNTYLIQFGDLVHDSKNESRKIFDFLNIKKGTLFQPRQTNEIGFSKEEKERILQSVQPRLDELQLVGITHLA